jgi:hypothetical protein
MGGLRNRIPWECGSNCAKRNRMFIPKLFSSCLLFMELYYCSNYPTILYPKTTTPKIICFGLHQNLINQKISYKKYCALHRYYSLGSFGFFKVVPQHTPHRQHNRNTVIFYDTHRRARGVEAASCDVGGADADACDGGDAQESRWSGGGCFPLQLVRRACGGGCCVGKSSGVAAGERDL